MQPNPALPLIQIMNLRAMLFTNHEVEMRRDIARSLLSIFRIFAKQFTPRIFIRALDDAVQEYKRELFDN